MRPLFATEDIRWTARASTGRQWPILRWAAWVALMVGVAFASLFPAASAAVAPSISWMINAHDVTLMQHEGASKSLLNQAFANSRSYLPGGSGTLGVRTATYDSYTAIQKAFASGALPGHFQAVVLDMEHWRFTPVSEQDDPAKFERLAAELVHSHKVDGHPMLLIAAPAVDIVLARCNCSSASSMRHQYLSSDIVGAAARYANIIDIPAQSVERNIPGFVAFVTRAARQARKANPGVVALAGLSTDYLDQEVYGNQLYRAFTAVRKMVTGFWLDVPEPGTYCPRCAGPYPAAALDFFKDVYR